MLVSTHRGGAGALGRAGMRAIGVVSSIEVDHARVQEAGRGREVCIKVEPATGDTGSKKAYGRHFDHADALHGRVVA